MIPAARFVIPATTLLALHASVGVAQQRAAITFRVHAAESRAPLPGAQVSVDGRVRGTTDARGVVRVQGLAPGTHRASVALLDRIPHGLRLQLAAGEEREVAVAMEPISVRLAPVTASASRRSRDARIVGFYRRAQDHITGRFVTRAEIEEKNATDFTDIFRGVAGVRIEPGPSGYVIRSPRAVSMGAGRPRSGAADGDGEMGRLITGGDCPPRYFVDGLPYSVSGPLNAEFSPTEIEGVEIYFGNVPPQWGGAQAMCGVILIWTRTNPAPATRN